MTQTDIMPGHKLLEKLYNRPDSEFENFVWQIKDKMHCV